MRAYRERRRHPNDWTPEQDDMLLSRVGSFKLATIAEKMGRTPHALKQRLWGHGERLRETAQRRAGMGIKDVASAMGVVKVDVWKWIDIGWLASKRAFGVERRYVTIDPDDLLFSISEHLALLPNIRPDEDWADAVAEARRALLDRLISGSDLSRALLHGRSIVYYLRTRLGFPDPALRLGGCLPDYYDRDQVRQWLELHPQYRTKEPL